MQVLFRLENVAINDTLPLNVARRDDIADLESFWRLTTPITVLDKFPSYYQTKQICQNF